jgi:predicted ATPase
VPLTRRTSGRVRKDVTSADVALRVVNFKSLASVELPPARITVLAGSNSSGKSSLLQAALFFAQSVQQAAPVINGDLVRLGGPSDVIRNGTDELAFETAFWESKPDGGWGLVSTRVTLRDAAGELRGSRFALQVQGAAELEAVEGRCPADLSKRLVDNEIPLVVVDPGRWDLPPDTYLSVIGLRPGRLIYPAVKDDYRKHFDQMLKQGAIRQYFVEELLRTSMVSHGETGLADELQPLLADTRHGRRARVGKLSGLEQDALFNLYFETENPGGWASEPISLGPLGTGRLGVRSTFSYQRKRGSSAPAAVNRLSDAARRMAAFSDGLVYLGPLREDPRVAYPLGHTVSNLPVGEKGEFTAAYLETHGDRLISCVTPRGIKRRESLLTAVSRWCRHLGIADEVNVESRGKMGHHVGLQVSGQLRDPTAIGVGASQLLPVVVLVLGAQPDQLVLLEQPELHLHPKVQSRLGDFFAWSRPDIRLLVETHSEYLITRLRLRVAEDELPADDLAVLFARQRLVEHVLEENGEEITDSEVFSEFRRLGLDHHGDFDAWPEDFFDTLENDTVALAQAVTRRLESESGVSSP